MTKHPQRNLQSHLEDFKAYLLHNRYSQSTIAVHQLRIKRLNQWSTSQGIAQGAMTYPQLLQYIKYLQTSKNYQRRSINNELRAVKLYYDYLMETNLAAENPATDTAIRGTITKAITQSLDPDDLEDLYYQYPVTHHDTFFRATKLRDKVVLGLVVFQGVTPIELHHMQIVHLQLEKAKVAIPGTRKSNGRTLRLQPCQMLAMAEYQTKVRPYLANRYKNDNPEKLFFGRIEQQHATVARLLRYMKTQNQNVKNGGTIRTSLIISWLKQYGLRKVQYMAGHRYISSTERYLQDDLESLQEMVTQFHPIT